MNVNSFVPTKKQINKRIHSEIENDEVLDGVKRVRFDQQFQEIMQQKESQSEWPIQTAEMIRFDNQFVMDQSLSFPGFDADWSSEVMSPSNQYRYLVRNSRARRKNNQSLPQDAYQMSFKFRA